MRAGKAVVLHEWIHRKEIFNLVLNFTNNEPMDSLQKIRWKTPYELQPPDRNPCCIYVNRE